MSLKNTFLLDCLRLISVKACEIQSDKFTIPAASTTVYHKISSSTCNPALPIVMYFEFVAERAFTLHSPPSPPQGV